MPEYILVGTGNLGSVLDQPLQRSNSGLPLFIFDTRTLAEMNRSDGPFGPTRAHQYLEVIRTPDPPLENDILEKLVETFTDGKNEPGATVVFPGELSVTNNTKKWRIAKSLAPQDKEVAVSKAITKLGEKEQAERIKGLRVNGITMPITSENLAKLRDAYADTKHMVGEQSILLKGEAYEVFVAVEEDGEIVKLTPSRLSDLYGRLILAHNKLQDLAFRQQRKARAQTTVTLAEVAAVVAEADFAAAVNRNAAGQ